MANVAEIARLIIRLQGDASNYKTALKQAELATAHTMKVMGRIPEDTAVMWEKTLVAPLAKMQARLAMISGQMAEVFGRAGRNIVDSVANFEQGIVNSSALINATTEDMKKMSDTALELGTRTVYGPTELAKAFYFTTSAGMSAAQSIAAMPAITRFATAGMQDLEQATSILITNLSAIGLRSADPEKNLKNLIRVSDVLTRAAARSDATLRQLAYSMTRQAGNALRAFNKDFEEGAAVLAVFGDQGVKGEMAGSLLARTLRLLSFASLKNAAAHREAAKMIGKESLVWDTVTGRMLNFADIAANFEKLLGRMSPQARAATLNWLGFDSRVQASIYSLLGVSDQIRTTEKLLRGAGITTKTVADRQMVGLANTLKILGNQFKVVGVEIGQFFVPAVRAAVGAVGAAVRWWRSLSTETRGLIVWVSAISGAFLLLIPTLRLAGLAVRGLVGYFAAWPKAIDLVAMAAGTAGGALRRLWAVVSLGGLVTGTVAGVLRGTFYTALALVHARVVMEIASYRLLWYTIKAGAIATYGTAVAFNTLSRAVSGLTVVGLAGRAAVVALTGTLRLLGLSLVAAASAFVKYSVGAKLAAAATWLFHGAAAAAATGGRLLGVAYRAVGLAAGGLTYSLVALAAGATGLIRWPYAVSQALYGLRGAMGAVTGAGAALALMMRSTASGTLLMNYAVAPLGATLTALGRTVSLLAMPMMGLTTWAAAGRLAMSRLAAGAAGLRAAVIPQITGLMEAITMGVGTAAFAAGSAFQRLWGAVAGGAAGAVNAVGTVVTAVVQMTIATASAAGRMLATFVMVASNPLMLIRIGLEGVARTAGVAVLAVQKVFSVIPTLATGALAALQGVGVAFDFLFTRGAAAASAVGGALSAITAGVAGLAGRITTTAAAFGTFIKASVAGFAGLGGAIRQAGLALLTGLLAPVKLLILPLKLIPLLFMGIKAAIAAAGTVFNTMFGGVGLLIGVLVAGGAAAAVFATKMGGIGKAWEKIKEVALRAWAVIVEKWEQFVVFIEPITQAVISFFTTAWSMVVEGATWLWGQVVSIFTRVKDYVMGVMGLTGQQANITWAGIRDTIRDAILFAEFTLLNFRQVASVAWLGIQLGAVVAFNTIVHYMTSVLPAAIMWLRENWVAIFTEVFRWTGSVVMVLTENIFNMFRNINWKGAWSTYKQQLMHVFRATGNLIIRAADVARGRISFAQLWGEDPAAEAVAPIRDIPRTINDELGRIRPFRMPERVTGELEAQIRADFERAKRELGISFEEFRKQRLAEFAKKEGAKAADALPIPREFTEEAKRDAAMLGNELGVQLGAGMDKGVQKIDAALFRSSEAISRIMEFRDRIARPDEFGGGPRGAKARPVFVPLNKVDAKTVNVDVDDGGGGDWSFEGGGDWSSPKTEEILRDIRDNTKPKKAGPEVIFDPASFR